MSTSLGELRLQFIEAAGNVTQSLGFGRILGQIFAHIYFSPDPQTLGDLTENLGVSKGSASMAVRQLEQWGALKRVWVKGERKDYYRAHDEFGKIIRKILVDTVGNKLELLDAFLEEAEHTLDDVKQHMKQPDPTELQYVRSRVERLRIFRDRGRKVWESSMLKLLLR